MARLLYGKELSLAEIKGGTNENDLATFCEVTIHTNEDVYAIFKKIDADIEKVDSIYCFNESHTKKIIKQILDLECGFVSDKKASANLGLIETIDDEVRIKYVLRGMNEKELEQINSRLCNLNNGFVVKEIYRDPIWKVDENSRLLEMYRKVYFKQYGKYPVNETWRGAIECATIKNHIEGLDIISIGSTIELFHTVEETTYISSWCKIYNLIIELLKEL